MVETVDRLLLVATRLLRLSVFALASLVGHRSRNLCQLVVLERVVVLASTTSVVWHSQAERRGVLALICLVLRLQWRSSLAETVILGEARLWLLLLDLLFLLVVGLLELSEVLLELELDLVEAEVELLGLVDRLLEDHVQLEVDVSLVLGALPSLVIVDDILVDDGNLLIDPEHLAVELVLDLALNRLNVLVELVDLLELVKKLLVADDALDHVDELITGEDVEWKSLQVDPFIGQLRIFKHFVELLLLIGVARAVSVLINVLLDHLNNLLMVEMTNASHTVGSQMVLDLLDVDSELSKVVHELILMLKHSLELIFSLNISFIVEVLHAN